MQYKAAKAAAETFSNWPFSRHFVEWRWRATNMLSTRRRVGMFGKLFGSKKQKKKEAQVDPKTAAFIQALRERSKEDPLIDAKLGGKEIVQRLLAAMSGSNGVHFQSLLTALGALAGYACQANLRAQALEQGKPETAPFQVLTTKDGKEYFFGNNVNKMLAEHQFSVWSLAAGATQHAGATELPDLNDLFKHSASVVGSKQFGIPRIPAEHRPGDMPLAYLKDFWPPLFKTVQLFCPDPIKWPILYGFAIQEAILSSKEVLDPGMTLLIVMESAIPMSKVDLANA
jgi:hypothetical protein